MINGGLVAAFASVIVCGGMVATRLYHHKARSELVARRMRQLWREELAREPAILVSSPEKRRLDIKWPVPTRILSFWERLLYQTGLSGRLADLALVTLILSVGLPAAAFGLGAPALACPVIGAAAGGAPTLWLLYHRARLRERFLQQLPSAIDLMVSVLKSGHSIPQAVRAVAEEAPVPCGAEFRDVLQRLNLGQTLPASLLISAQRLESFDLDLITKAVAIQSEVGGSLAELLEKTNGTIRDRIKLARQVKALTAQSRLSALIVGVMPFILAFLLESMSPGYLTPLVTTETGKTLFVLAVVLQLAGIVIMTRLSTIKV